MRKIDWRLMVSDEFSKWDSCNEQQLTMHAANPMYDVLPCKSAPIILSSDEAFRRSSCEAHGHVRQALPSLDTRASAASPPPLGTLNSILTRMVELRGPQRYRPSAPQQSREGSQYDRRAIQHYCLHFVRRLRAYASCMYTHPSDVSDWY